MERAKGGVGRANALLFTTRGEVMMEGDEGTETEVQKKKVRLGAMKGYWVNCEGGAGWRGRREANRMRLWWFPLQLAANNVHRSTLWVHTYRD